LPVYPWYLRLFTAFSAKDHLGDPKKSIKENVENFLALNNNEKEPPARILMLANARIFGHTFDPLTIYWCLDEADSVRCVLAEVRNTYGQRHLYLLQTDSLGRAQTPKEFHVSPFLDISGRYDMRFTLSPDFISTTVSLVRNENTVFAANFHGTPRAATKLAIIKQLIIRPLMTQRISLLIRVHGIWLWFRRLPVYRLPHHNPQVGA